MINARELRIGNFIFCKHKDGAHRICSISKNDSYTGGYKLDVSGDAKISIDYATPILLTEELLLKCGFYKVGATFGSGIEVGIYHVGMKGYCLSLLDDMGLMFCHCNGNDYTEYEDITPICSISYLHQLQNIFFDLTCKELEVNL